MTEREKFVDRYEDKDAEPVGLEPDYFAEDDEYWDEEEV
jgi:hypothetical protein